MSAFLGPIHYWLFRKIRFQEDFVQYILTYTKRMEQQNPIIEQMDQKCKTLENGELSDIIDKNNIHGWLQERIAVVENRLAFLVTAIIKEHPNKLSDITSLAYAFGRKYAVEPGITVKDAYLHIDNLIVNGMPCDRVNEITEEDDKHILWQQTTEIHAGYWNSIGGNVEYYYAIRESLIKGMLDNSGIVYRKAGGQTYEMRKAEKLDKAVSAAAFRAERTAKTNALKSEKGHPLRLFARENEALKKVLKDIKEELQAGRAAEGKTHLALLKDLAIHYAKKGDLLYPLLKVKYGVAGPSDLLWTTDDEIRDEISGILKNASPGTLENDSACIPANDSGCLPWRERVEKLITKIEEMIFKEENVTFPSCAVYFSEEEWIGIYFDQKDYKECFGVKGEVWEKAENSFKEFIPYTTENEVFMAGGHMTVEQLTALFNTIPLEITFIDAHNFNRFFNEGPKDFKRPKLAIDREVFSCHPPKVEAQVKKIINEFRTGTLDEVPIWMEKGGKCLLVKYMAVRDKDRNYLGTVELVQNMDFAKEHFSKLLCR